MDPLTERLDASPRHLDTDAFFAADRSATAVVRDVPLIAVDADGEDRRDVRPGTEHFTVYLARYATDVIWAKNPLPHQRRTDPVGKKPGKLDTSIVGWTHPVGYTCFFSSAARALARDVADQPRLRVKVLFGTGSEGLRHGVFAMLEDCADPTLLIVVGGIEPRYRIEFTHPTDRTRRVTLAANNRWACGITVAVIESAIQRRYGALISYSITDCAGFSTGYLGVQESLRARLFPVDALRLVIFYDCLYGSLRGPLEQLRATAPGVRIVAYVVTGGGNSFTGDASRPTFGALVLGRMPGWHYVNLLGNLTYLAVGCARVVTEGTTAPVIIDKLPSGYPAVLSALAGRLPARGTLVSDRAVIAAVRGSLPAGTTGTLADLAADPTTAAAVTAFNAWVDTTRRCLGRAQLLGWPAPPGEEWHDLLLVEFAWELLG